MLTVTIPGAHWVLRHGSVHSMLQGLGSMMYSMLQGLGSMMYMPQAEMASHARLRAYRWPSSEDKFHKQCMRTSARIECEIGSSSSMALLGR